MIMQVKEPFLLKINPETSALFSWCLRFSIMKVHLRYTTSLVADIVVHKMYKYAAITTERWQAASSISSTETFLSHDLTEAILFSCLEVLDHREAVEVGEVGV